MEILQTFLQLLPIVYLVVLSLTSFVFIQKEVENLTDKIVNPLVELIINILTLPLIIALCLLGIIYPVILIINYSIWFILLKINNRR